uniref:Uncharacterized protein n=1 Tax=Rhizophora mucronata TaxID=61149 RepID=A0A2P2PY42_RHIMU
MKGCRGVPPCDYFAKKITLDEVTFGYFNLPVSEVDRCIIPNILRDDDPDLINKFEYGPPQRIITVDTETGKEYGTDLNKFDSRYYRLARVSQLVADKNLVKGQIVYLWGEEGVVQFSV